MAYKINFFDQTTTPIDVQDRTLNTDTHLTFVGKNWFGYGESIAENQLKLLENCASNTVPDIAKAVEGQLYYNKDEKSYFSCVINGSTKEWQRVPGSALDTMTIVDDVSVEHVVTVAYKSGTDLTEIAFIISTDADFTVNTTAGINPAEIVTNFASIKSGITMTTATGFKFHGTATTAEYADLAEMYASDAAYAPGTVVKIGGEAEVTQTTSAFDPEVFGIVSTDPAYLMNSEATGTSVAVALEGRVPVKVIGQVKKGQRLLSSEEPGVARAPTDYEMQEYMDWYRIVGRALEDKTSEGIGLVEVVVGTK